MPTYKNITVKMKNGRSRKQRVQVLASGKYKFVKNLVGRSSSRSSRSSPKRRKNRRSASKKVKNTAKGNGKMFRTLGTKGALEDFAWGFGGLALMGPNNPVALPAIRLIQGVQGHVFNRTGKGRLVYSLIDLVDLVVAGQASVQSIFDSIRQLSKIVPAV